jgi:predicted Fe-Mo cluster-binding NifX family protein
MKIAITSQNRREVTEHAGMCRKFWVYEIENAQTKSKQLLELPKEQSFHESSPLAPHPLDDIAALISGGMGQGMVRRLAAKGISAIITDEKDPDAAIAALLAGRLTPLSLEQGCQCGHGHDHHHHDHG